MGDLTHERQVLWRVANANTRSVLVESNIASLSSFYKYLSAAAAELRLPIIVPNLVHAQFVARQSADPRQKTKALSATRARQLMGMPAGEDFGGLS